MKSSKDPAPTERERSDAQWHLAPRALLVLLVLAVLSSWLLTRPPLFGSGQPRAKTAEEQARILKSALDTMRLDLDRYPSTEEGLALLVTKPRDAALAARWHGPYLEGPVPLDPWKHPYHYSQPGKLPYPFALYSDGPNPSDGTVIGFPPPD
jgi:general secretion pathway protein G